MLIKSQNQRYLLKFEYIEEPKGKAIIYLIEQKNLIEKNSLNVICGAGGDRIAVSNDGNYILSAIYEKKFYIYDMKNNYNIKTVTTQKCIEAVLIMDEKAHIIYIDGSIDVFTMKGDFIENQQDVETLPMDICGEQYLVEDSFISLGTKRIKPSRFTLFNSVIKQKDRIIVSELFGRVACYDFDGNLLWEYLSDTNVRFGKIAYSQCINKVIVEIFYYRQRDKNKELHFLNTQDGALEFKKEIAREEVIFLDMNNMLVDRNLNILELCDMNI